MIGSGLRAVRNTFLLLSVRVVTRFLALITWIATANYLGDSHFGQFQTLSSYVALVMVLVDLGMSTLYVLEAARRPNEIDRYLSNMLAAKAVASIIGLLLLAVSLGVPGLRHLLLPGFALLVLTSFSSLLRSTFFVLGTLTYEAIAILIESTLLLSLVIYGIRTGRDLIYFIWAFAATHAVSVAYSLAILSLRRLIRFRLTFEPAFILAWLRRGLPFAISFALSHLYFKLDVPILQRFRGYAEVGWYTFAYKPFEALLFVPLTMLQVVFPMLSAYYEQSEGRLGQAYQSFFKALALIGLPIGLGTVILTPGLVQLLHLYPQSEPALRILGVGIVFLFVNNAFIAALNAAEGQSLLAWAMLSTLLLNVGLDFALIPAFGYLGASWATVLTEAWLGIAGWFLARRLGLRLDWWRTVWRVGLAGAVMAVFLLPVRDASGAGLILAILLGAALYALALWFFKALAPSELDIALRALRLRR